MVENDGASKKKIHVQSTLMESTSCQILPEEDSHIVYSIGYEGLNSKEFAEKLKCHRIVRLIDVRERASSRKAGFSKTALSLSLKEEGIEYIHLRALGAPPDIRHEYKGGGSQKTFFEDYERHIREDSMEELETLKKYVSEKTSVLMCFETSYLQCHRRILADMLKDAGFRVKHL